MNVIFGAGGFAREVHFLIKRCRAARQPLDALACFVVADQDPLVGQQLHGVPVRGETHFFEAHAGQTINCFVAVGAPALRQKIVTSIRRHLQPVFPVLLDPSVIYDRDRVMIAEGTIVCAGTILTTDIQIKAFTQINLDCTVGHDVVIDAFSTLSPGVHVSGGVQMGSSCFIGTGAVILENLQLAEKTVVGAGAVVTTHLTEAGIYIGVPARKRG